MKNRTCRVAWTMIMLAQTAFWSLAQSTYEPYTFTSLAGNASSGSTDGIGGAGKFDHPSGVAVDVAGNVYVADTDNHTIRKVTPAGVVTTLAGLAGIWGSADGTGSAARFYQPTGVAVDSVGNVYVADKVNDTIRKVTPAGVVTTLAGLPHTFGNGSADGTGTAARFGHPTGVAVDSAGNVYVADTWNGTIREVTPAGVVTTLAGLARSPGSADGTGNAARFNRPGRVAVDTAGNVYVADSGNYTIRRVTAAGVVTTLAGLAQCCDANGNPVGGSVDGTGSAARFSGPSGVAVDNVGNVYVADSGTIRKVTPAGVVTTLAGLAQCCDVNRNPVGGSADGTGSNARFNFPSDVAVDSAGNLSVADAGNNTIRKVTPAGEVTTLAGLALAGLAGSAGSVNGTGSNARFYYPYGVAVDSAGNVYVADTRNYTIRKITPAGEVTTLAGSPGQFGSDDGTGSAARFGSGEFLSSGPNGVVVDRPGNVYVADTGNATIRKITAAGAVTTLAGSARQYGSADGTGSAARFNGPSGVAVDSAGNVYVADAGALRKVTPAGVVTTLAGLAGGSGVAVDSAGNVYVAEGGTIRKVTPAGEVMTLAGQDWGSADGTGSAARFAEPFGVAVDSASNVYVADRDNNTIRKVTPAGVVTTLAGLPYPFGKDSTDGTGSAGRFNYPTGVAVDSAGNVYVADSSNNTIRKGYPAPRILNSGPGFGFNDGQFGFNLAGPTGKLVVVEASTDLVSWLPIWTNTFAGALNFSDRQSSVSPNRFYRAHLP